MENCNIKVKAIKAENKSSILQVLALIAIIFIVFISLPALCQSHSEIKEPPSFKYSREANEHDDHRHHHHHHHDHDERKKPDPVKSRKVPLVMTDVWIYSIGSTFIISAAPFLLLYVIPLDNSESMKPRLKILLAFASGGLLGDAFLHLIPHASHSHSHNHDHESESHDHHDHSSHGHDMTIGMWILGGIIAFLVVDKMVRILKGTSGHGHSHGGESKKETPSKVEMLEDDKPTTSSTLVNRKNEKKTQTNKIDSKKKESSSKIQEDEVDVSGYLNLAADFAHNFTDGLAIGASYLAGNSIGAVTTVTILLHEVPHEIGDFAILIKAGCSKKKAMMLQLVTAFGALAGTSLALFGAADSDVTPVWVMPFTAGGFIYIATVSVLPELLEGSTKLGQSLKEIAALLAGVIIMIFIALYE